MGYTDIIYNKKGHVGTIAINRPKFINAIRYETMLEIRDAFKEIDNDDSIRVVVITGTGNKAFISGGDIEVMSKGSGYLEVLHTLPIGQQILSDIENYRKPVIAKINGFALGGGTEVACACDIRIAVDTAFMGIPEITLGIIPGYGGTQRLPRLIGMGRAKELLFTGEYITAQEAFRMGLVNKVVPREKLDESVAILCEKIVQKSPLALALGKEAINYGMQTDIRTGLEIEARCFSLCFDSEDRLEGMKAFLEKRKPNFKGR